MKTQIYTEALSSKKCLDKILLLLSQFIYYYYINYFTLINGIYIGIVLGIVSVL
jgi:hypothetical protein